jgi:hypothetical protein
MPRRTINAQIQDIADWMHGIDIEPKPTGDAFTAGPLRAAWDAIAWIHYNGDQTVYLEHCRSALKPILAAYPTGARLMARIEATITSTVQRPFPSLAEIADTLTPVQWAWPGWLPIGMLTLLAAKPGSGKSMLALDLAHRLIAGDPWPDGAPMPRPGASVIYVDGENVPQLLNERAVAWQMPRDRLYLLLPDEEDIIIDLTQTKYQDKLAQMAYRLEPGLIVIDSLGSIMGRGENAIEDVRAILAYLASLANTNNCALLLIHHLRKSGNGQLALDGVDPDMIRGSGHIAAMARVAWGLATVQTGPQPDRNGPRKLEVIKSNLAKYPDAIGLVMEPLPGDAERVRISYTRNAPEPFSEPTAADECRAWLLDYLTTAGEPLKPADIIQAAQEHGYNRAMIYRARESLADRITNTAGRRNPGNCWQITAAADDDAQE